MKSKYWYKNKSKYDIYFILLILQIGIFLFLNIFWEYNSFIMPFSENGVHIQYAKNLPAFELKNLIDAPYPKLLHYLTKPLLNVFTNEKWAFFSVSSFFAIINVIAAYCCTASLCNGRIALFAASSLLWLPLTAIASRIYILDYPQATCITLWLLCFLKSRRFTKILPSIGFVVLIFLSSLFRYTYFTYIIPCFIGMAYHLYNRKLSNNLKSKHLIISALPLAYSASLFFTKNWIIAVQIIGIILFLEGLILFSKEKSMGKLFSFTGLGLIISIYFFCLFADQAALNNIAHQERINISTSLDFNLINPKYYLSCLSLLLLNIAFAVRIKLLTPVLFWYFTTGTVLIIGIPKLRHKYLILLFPLTVCPLYLLFTHAEDRFQAPLLTFFCMIAAVWLDGNKLRHLKSFLYAAGIAIIILSGSYISGGWLISNSAKLPAYLLTAGIGRKTISAKPQGNIIQIKEKKVFRINFNEISTLANFCSLKSQWSDSFLYTFDTYKINWMNCLEPIMQLPDKTTLQVKFLWLSSIKDEYRVTGTLEEIISYCASKKHKDIIISNKGQYILRIQSLDDTRQSVKKMEEELSEELSEEAINLKSWQANNYFFTLYKRKTI